LILHLMHCAISLLAHSYSYTLDHVEPETEIQAEQVQWVVGGSQASNCEDANIVVIKTSPGSSHPILDFYFELISLC
jgi:hypothetical protein